MLPYIFAGDYDFVTERIYNAQSPNRRFDFSSMYCFDPHVNFPAFCAKDCLRGIAQRNPARLDKSAVFLR